MPRFLIPFIASLLTLTMGLGVLLGGRGVVICSDSHGARVEVACVQDEIGQCNTGHDATGQGDDHRDDRGPCEDQPLKNTSDSSTHVQHRVELPAVDGWPVPQPIALIAEPLVQSQRVAVVLDESPRPPDPLLSLRTIVLTV